MSRRAARGPVAVGDLLLVRRVQGCFRDWPMLAAVGLGALTGADAVLVKVDMVLGLPHFKLIGFLACRVR